MLSLTCAPDLWFGELCTTISQHDQSGVIGPVVQRLLGPVLVFALVYVLGRLLRSGLERAIKHAGGDSQVRTLVHNVVTAATIAFAVLAALVQAGLNLSVLLTVGGISTLAVGLAFQDLLRNVVAGMFLLLEHPFRIGDVITVENKTGIVQAIHLRTTSLRTADGVLVVLPNLVAFNSVLVNSSAFGTRQFAVAVHLPDGVPLDHLIAAIKGEIEKTKELATKPAPQVVPHIAADGVTSVEAKYWLDYNSQNVDAVNADVTARVWAVAHASAPEQH